MNLLHTKHNTNTNSTHHQHKTLTNHCNFTSQNKDNCILTYCISIFTGQYTTLL